MKIPQEERDPAEISTMVNVSLKTMGTSPTMSFAADPTEAAGTARPNPPEKFPPKHTIDPDKKRTQTCSSPTETWLTVRALRDAVNVIYPKLDISDASSPIGETLLFNPSWPAPLSLIKNNLKFAIYFLNFMNANIIFLKNYL
jgi:hypothetical protein